MLRIKNLPYSTPFCLKCALKQLDFKLYDVFFFDCFFIKKGSLKIDQSKQIDNYKISFDKVMNF